MIVERLYQVTDARYVQHKGLSTAFIKQRIKALDDKIFEFERRKGRAGWSSYDEAVLNRYQRQLEQETNDLNNTINSMKR